MMKLSPEQMSAERMAGEALRKLIQENYSSQEEFAYEYGYEIRTISRYINQGITKIATIQEFANIFNMDFIEFFYQIK